MNNKLPKSFNEELRRLRLISKKQSKDIALALGFSPAWLSKVESGQIALDKETYNKIKNCIGADTEEGQIPKSVMDEIYKKAFECGFEKGKKYGYVKAKKDFYSILKKYEKWM